jgi:uncharacterized Zn-binding protein involved in type VI secretion
MSGEFWSHDERAAIGSAGRSTIRAAVGAPGRSALRSVSSVLSDISDGENREWGNWNWGREPISPRARWPIVIATERRVREDLSPFLIPSMAQPAARLGDMHVCPMVAPAVPPIPHVGGPVSMGAATVLIGGVPAARVGDMCVCVGPPDVIAMGSPKVFICGSPAARMGDPTAPGGSVVVGCFTVLIS